MDGRTPQAQRFFPAGATCRKVIKHVQQELARRGIYSGPVNRHTSVPPPEGALVAFQKHTRLTR